MLLCSPLAPVAFLVMTYLAFVDPERMCKKPVHTGLQLHTADPN
jgi:hypothetical protein